MLAFVLGGGGSRGALQVGALRVLVEHGIVPEMVIGTSVGALNAALFAHNPTLEGLNELEKIWRSVQQEDVFPGKGGKVLANLMRRREGLFENTGWLARMKEELPATYFNELQLTCYAVATDVVTGDVRVFGDLAEDRLLDGLMASSAVSPLHPSWRVGEKRYIDGAFVSNLPVRLAYERGATEIIALNLNGRLMDSDAVNNPAVMINHMLDIMQQHQIKSQMDYVQSQPFVRVRKIDLNCGDYLSIIDFEQSAALMARGRELMEAALTKDSWSWLARKQAVEDQ